MSQVQETYSPITSASPSAFSICGYYDKKNGNICYHHASKSFRHCFEHLGIWEYLSDPIAWQKTKEFFDTHVFCNYAREKSRVFSVAYYEFYPRDKLDPRVNPKTMKTDEFTVRIWNDEDTYNGGIFALINPDGSNNFDESISSEDYAKMLRDSAIDEELD